MQVINKDEVVKYIHDKDMIALSGSGGSGSCEARSNYKSNYG